MQEFSITGTHGTVSMQAHIFSVIKCHITKSWTHSGTIPIPKSCLKNSKDVG